MNKTITERISDEYFDLAAVLRVEEYNLKPLRDKVDEAKRKLRERQTFLRMNPSSLCAEIATIIRREDVAEDENGFDLSDQDDAALLTGTHHWFQNAWGAVTWNMLTHPDQQIVTPGGDVVTNRYSVVVSCPTTACVAGWVGSLTGHRMLFPAISDLSENRSALGEVFQTTDYFLTPDGTRRRIPEVAAEILGLDEERAGWLFNGYRTKAGVLWALDQMAAGDFNWPIPEYYAYMVEEGRE